MGLSVELVAKEREGWDALCGNNGGDYYREHLAAHARMAFSFGVLTREQAIEAMDAAPPWRRFEMSDIHVLPLGDSAGVVVYTVEAERDGQDVFKATVSSTFVLQDGEWRLAFHQQSA